MAGKSEKVNTKYFGKYYSPMSYKAFTIATPKKQAEIISSSFINFIRFGLGAYPIDYLQAEFVLSVDDALAGKKPKRIAVRSGHGVGKSTLLSWLIMYLGLTTKDCKIITTAPVSSQLTEQIIPEIKKWKANMYPTYKNLFIVNTQQIKFNNSNLGIFRTARKENTEAMAGVHASFVLVAIDEASGVNSQIFEVLDGATSNNSLYVMTGNPTRKVGKFYDAFHKDNKLYQTIHMDSEKSKNVKKEWIADMKKKYGEDSDVYRVRVLGDFPRLDVQGLFEEEVIDNAMSRTNEPDNAVTMAVDPARFGDDKTTIWLKRGTKAILKETIKGKDTMAIANIVQGIFTKENAGYVVIDTIGIGAGVYDRLKQMNVNVIDGNSAKASVDPNHYANKRAEMYDRLAEWLTYGDIPEDDDLKEELLSTTYFFTNTGKMQIVAKDTIKEDIHRSPDKADGLALLFYTDDLPMTVSTNPQDYISQPIL